MVIRSTRTEGYVSESHGSSCTEASYPAPGPEKISSTCGARYPAAQNNTDSGSVTGQDIRSKKACKSLIHRLLANFGIATGREQGIRTLDTLLGYTHFPGVLLRPLGQLSLFIELQIYANRKHICKYSFLYF